MERTTEIELAQELLQLKGEGAHFLDEKPASSPVDHYVSQERFELEREAIFLRQPHAAAHSSELPEPGSFLRLNIHGKPVLLTRDKQGEVHAFLNVCRHRGAQLVAQESGCQHRFSCPYHAWTYASDGRLLAAPHFAEGFPGLDKSEMGLTALPCTEALGFVWVVPTAGSAASLRDLLGPLREEVAQLAIGEMSIVAEDRITCRANWKILIEGGIEAYHFKVAHRDTIGPYFEDNLSTYQCFGNNMRSVLPRASIGALRDLPQDQWRLRDHANLIYTMFPGSQLLVQQDHLIWISIQPGGPDETHMRLTTLAPTSGPEADGKDAAYWQRNHAITMKTLNEDFAIGAGIQEGLKSGANSQLTFGRFEGALEAFNGTVDRLCAQFLATLGD